ncbi:MAG: twin-arginine translocase TatA/TatE family subunit [Actinobacteria bacterium]|nr:twin-arginine translocase TatA/TatE family subunit [Actinomycetota bacterium]
MSAPGFWEVVALVVVALFVFGPEKLPELARNAGRTIGRLKQETNATLDELKRSADLGDVRDVADDLRATSRELRGSTDLRGSVAASARGRPEPGAARRGRLPADQPPPFDADAT